MAGDLPEALARYDSAEDYYEREGLSVARILLDRSAVLLQAGLLDEARQVLTRAVDELTQSRADADAAEGLVALAQVALAQGDSAAAAGAARLAVRLMTRQGRPGWTLLARQVLFTAEVDGLEPKLAARRGVRLAALLRDAGWREEEQEVLLLSTRAAIADGDLATPPSCSAGRAAFGTPVRRRCAIESGTSERCFELPRGGSRAPWAPWSPGSRRWTSNAPCWGRPSSAPRSVGRPVTCRRSVCAWPCRRASRPASCTSPSCPGQGACGCGPSDRRATPSWPRRSRSFARRPRQS